MAITTSTRTAQWLACILASIALLLGGCNASSKPGCDQGFCEEGMEPFFVEVLTNQTKVNVQVELTGDAFPPAAKGGYGPADFYEIPHVRRSLFDPKKSGAVTVMAKIPFLRERPKGFVACAIYRGSRETPPVGTTGHGWAESRDHPGTATCTWTHTAEP